MDEPPPDPLESSQQTLLRCLEDLRRAGFTIPTSAIVRIEPAANPTPQTSVLQISSQESGKFAASKNDEPSTGTDGDFEPQAATMATLSSHPPTMATPSPLPALMTKSIQSDPQVRDRPQTIGENIAPQIMATPVTSVQAISTPAVIATTGSRAEITRQVLADLWDRGYRIPPSTFRELNRDAQTMDYTRTAPITGSLATRNQKQNRKPKVKGAVRKPSGGQTTLQKLQLMGNNLLPGHEPGMTSTDFGNFNLVSNLTLPSSVILGNNARTDNDLHGTSARVFNNNASHAFKYNLPSSTHVEGITCAHTPFNGQNDDTNNAIQNIAHQVPPSANVPNNHANISISDANNPSRSGGLLSAPNLTSKDPQHLPGYKSVPIISEKIVETHRGEACITFEDCEVQQMNMLENTLLIGKFSHGRPLLSVIREHFTKSFVLKGSIEIGLVDPRHVFLSFSNPEDCIEILIKGQILFNGKCPMRIFRWTPEFDTRFETSLALVWVLLPNLKAHCFYIPCIKQIVKPIGRFLHVDADTAKFSRPNVAKVKVEVDLMKPLRQKIFIRLGSKIPGREDFGFWQSIEYEKIPPYCLTCWKQGHLSSSCRVNRARVDPYMGNSQPPRDPSGTNNAFAGDNGSSLGVSNHPPTHRPQVQPQVTFSKAFDPQRLSKNQRKHQNRKARKEKGKSPIVESLNDVGTTTAITEVGFRRDEATTSRDTTFYIPITTSNDFAELQVDDDNQTSQTAPVFQPLAPTDCTGQLSPILEDSEKAASPSTQPLLGPLPLYQGLDHAQAQEDNHSPAQPPPSPGEASSTRQVFSFPPTIPVTAGPHTPLREAGTGGCGLNTDQVLIPTISPVAHPSSPAPTVKHLRRTKSSSEGSNIAMFYREASDDESESSIAGTIALFESVGRIKTSLGHGSPPRVPHVPFGDRFTPLQLESFKVRLGFDSSFAGANGKLWLLWNSDLSLNLESESDQSVSVSCSHASIPYAFWTTFVYAKTKERLRTILWTELCSVSYRIPQDVPWAVVGDFNCLLNVDEKKGGLPYPHRKTTDFRKCTSTCDLIDSSAYGSSYTWWNGRRKKSAIWMRLDRFLYTSVWESKFRTSVHHLSRTSSDHCPLLITSQVISAQPIPKHFIFLNVWTKHEDFLRVVSESWDVPVEGAPMYVLATKLSRLQKALVPWNKESFGNIFTKLQELEDKVQLLEDILQQNPDDDRALIDYKKSTAFPSQSKQRCQGSGQRLRASEVCEGSLF
nr:uncharacterized protein LOC109164037 [Ipomoea batatas]